MHGIRMSQGHKQDEYKPIALQTSSNSSDIVEAARNLCYDCRY